jgi:hypothetical protein
VEAEQLAAQRIQALPQAGTLMVGLAVAQASALGQLPRAWEETLSKVELVEALAVAVAAELVE